MSADLRSAVIDIGMSLNLRPAEASLIVWKAAEPGCRPGRSQRKSRAITCADRALIQISRPHASAFWLRTQYAHRQGRGAAHALTAATRCDFLKACRTPCLRLQIWRPMLTGHAR